MTFQSWMRVLAGGLILCIPAVPPVSGAAIMASLVPGGNTLGANDDGSAPFTPIGFSVDFFGTTYAGLYVNNNGNVTFDGALSTFTPFGLTTNTGTPIIAPFFADVDTRGAGSGLVTYGQGTLTTLDSTARNVFVANWVNVGYFGSHTDKLNSFQLVLVDRTETGAGNFDIVFNYDQILWETGDASGGSGGLGGNSARVGYSSGSGSPGTFAEFTGSGINGGFLNGGPYALVGDTNVIVGDPLYESLNGRYVLEVRGGQVGGGEIPEPATFGTAACALLGLGLGLRVRRQRG